MYHGRRRSKRTEDLKQECDDGLAPRDVLSHRLLDAEVGDDAHGLHQHVDRFRRATHFVHVERVLQLKQRKIHVPT